MHAPGPVQESSQAPVAEGFLMRALDLRTGKLISRCALAAFVAAPGLALAQATQGKAPTSIEEITVTAQKRTERLIDVPLSITAFSGQSIVDSGAVQLSDFIQTAPGVGIVDDQSGTQNIQIRGINSTFGNAPVGYYLDELPFSLIGNTQVPDVRTYDLDRIEVLRGPQGTLYGDGSIGGTIRLLTKDPDLGGFAGNLDLTGANVKDGGSNYAVKGMLNMPIAKDLAALRIVGSREETGGWIDNVTTGEDDQNERDIDNYRAKLRIAPTDRLDVVFGWWHNEEDVTGDGLARDDRTTADPAATYDVEYDLYSATVRYDFGGVNLVSASSWLDYQDDSITWIAGTFDFLNETGQDVFSQEVRLVSDTDSALRWSTGLYFRKTERDTYAALPAFFFTQDIDMESKAWAAFGELTWTVLDEAVDITVGGRYFEDKLDYAEVVDPFLLGLIQGVDPTFDGAYNVKFDTFNPRFNVAWRPAENWTVYANVAKGFRSGQAQPAISLGLALLSGLSIPSAIDPENLWSYELGVKGTFMDGRALVEAAIYHNDWKKLQVPVAVSPQVRALVNGGSAQTRGAEVGLTLMPLKGLTFNLSAAYTDAEFTDDVTGINISDGDRIPEVPKTTFASSATYRWPLLDGMDGFVYAGMQNNAKRTDELNFAEPGQAITSIDLRVGLEAAHWAAYLFADNLNDEDDAVSPYALGPQGPATRLMPRTIGLQLRTMF
jgi:outer membrane receptor protein involved in Fe transport